jgi:hypothetical protein
MIVRKEKEEFVKKRERSEKESRKQKIKKGGRQNMFCKNKIEVIPFREFMAGTHHSQKEAPRTNSIYAMSAFFPTITPGSFFPVHDPGFALFLIGEAAIVGSAFFQHFAAKSGSPAISEAIGAISGFVFPVVVYGAIFWFFIAL